MESLIKFVQDEFVTKKDFPVKLIFEYTLFSIYAALQVNKFLSSFAQRRHLF